jgi:hypothetical protein
VVVSTSGVTGKGWCSHLKGRCTQPTTNAVCTPTLFVYLCKSLQYTSGSTSSSQHRTDPHQPFHPQPADIPSTNHTVACTPAVLLLLLLLLLVHVASLTCRLARPPPAAAPQC